MKKKKQILLILLLVAVALVVVYFTAVRPTVNKKEKTTLEPVELLEGEGYYRIISETNQIPTMFPPIERGDIYDIRIAGEEETYGFTHVLSGGKDYFLMWNEDGEGKRTVYYPELARISAAFDYTSLYDETSKIPSLINSTGNINFKERVYIRADDETAPTDEEFQSILHRYGLADADHPVSFEIRKLMRDGKNNLMYTDGEALFCTDGNKTNPRYYDAITLATAGYDYAATPTVDVTGLSLSVLPGVGTVRVYVGEQTPDEKGYYLRLEGRDVVYSTGTASVGRVVYRTLSYYIQPRLVQASGNQNLSYAVYTPSFRLFSGTGAKTDGIAATDTILFSSSSALRDGMSADATGALALGSGTLPDDLVDALVASGKAAGETIPLLFGTTTDLHWNLKSGDKTEYKIYAVVAVIRGGEYLDEEGTAVLAGDRAICLYTADGNSGTGLIDLSEAPAELSDAIVGLSVAGTVPSEPVATATVDFSTADKTATVYQVESIRAYARRYEAFPIYLATGKASSGLTIWSNDKTQTQTATLPTSGSLGWVYVTYSVKRDGVLAVEEAYLCLDGGNDTLALDNMAAAIRKSDAASGGVTLGYREGIKTTVALPADPFVSYLVYRDFKIEGIYGCEEELGVAYVNDTERDIFHGGSAYEIRTPADRTVYSVNNDNLMDVLQAVFTEAKGSETVAVGLTKENFDKYGLGAHALTIKIPFGLAYRDGTTMDVGITSCGGYRLYISDRKTDADGDYYYAASDLYGIVVKAKVADCDLSFVDWDFLTKWADDDLLLLDLLDVRDVTFRINYKDLKETHGFAVSVNRSYYSSDDEADVTNKLYVAYVPGASPAYRTRIEDGRNVEPDSRNYAARTASGKPYYRTDYGVQITKIDDNNWSVRSVTNAGAIGLDEHYLNQKRKVDPGAELEFTGLYFEGVSNFTKLMTLIYTSKYSGEVDLADATTQEKADLVAALLERDGEGGFVHSDEDPDMMEHAVFTITMTLVDGRVFRLAFYPYSDGRYLLSFEDCDAGIVSREFYMNMGEIKNIVTAVRTVVAGGSVRYDRSYLPDVPITTSETGN